MPRTHDGIELPGGIQLRECTSGVTVVAEIVGLNRDLAKFAIDRDWWSLSQPRIQGLENERDRTWKWHKLVGTMNTQLGRFGFAWAAQVADRVEGAILYQVGAESELLPGLPTLMIYRLASAPWNRDWICESPRFKGVGAGLLRLAVFHSQRYGMGGRTTVEAYSDEKVLSWYEQFGLRQ
jgi:hypothetical protein